jgi:hypothetical protein
MNTPIELRFNALAMNVVIVENDGTLRTIPFDSDEPLAGKKFFRFDDILHHLRKDKDYQEFQSLYASLGAKE